MMFNPNTLPIYEKAEFLSELALEEALSDWNNVEKHQAVLIATREWLMVCGMKPLEEPHHALVWRIEQKFQEKLGWGN